MLHVDEQSSIWDKQTIIQQGDTVDTGRKGIFVNDLSKVILLSDIKTL